MSDITNAKELLSELKKLNPDVSFGEYDFRWDAIYASVPVWKLKLPESFYLDEKNYITNKHRTDPGSYTVVEILPLK
jgi:hypothetical protein